MKFLFKFSILLFCLFSFSLIQSAEKGKKKEPEFIDIANCINDRTKQYPLKDYTGIYLLSPARTGSTVVFNILRFLFESEENKSKPGYKNFNCLVNKTHHLYTAEEDYLYVFTIRNPIDATFSHYRIKRGEGNENIGKLVYKLASAQISLWRNLEKLLSLGRKVIILRYEDFVNNIDFVFDTLEDELSFSIAKPDKVLLRKALSKENVLYNIRHFESFEDYDRIHGFHGKHIDEGEISAEEKAHVTHLIIQALQKYRPIIERWGYTLPEPEIKP
jgi:hypothetical protein